MTPFYQKDGVTIYHGDCRKIAPAIKADCVLSDPPWGTDTACDSGRFTSKSSPWWGNSWDKTKIKSHHRIVGDVEEFDPRPFITGAAILWGANHFTKYLPHSGGWLVWDKRAGVEDVAEKGWPLGEAELAWTNIRGSVRVFRNLWMGLLRSSDRGEFYHPTQKPTRLMEWCLGFMPPGIVLDPFMGSGSTLVAAKQLGREAIGIEIEERYCAIAAKRLAQMQLPLEVEGLGRDGGESARIDEPAAPGQDEH